MAPALENQVDHQYVRELRARGFTVDWTDGLQELTSERVRSYNTIALFTSPAGFEAATGAQQPLGAEERFNEVVQEFLALGGGVLMMPEEKNIGVQRLRALTDAWGAQVTAERIIEREERRQGELERGSHRVSLAYTDAIAPSPLTQGVKGLWYPVMPAFHGAMTLPIVVDSNWSVIVRGSTSSVSAPIDLSSAFDAAPGLIQRTTREPALFAVRAAGAGRIALVAQWPQFTFSAGTMWLYDRVVLERGVGGRQSDFGVLLENTLRWLSAPSLANGKLGGWREDREPVPANVSSEIQKYYRPTPSAYRKEALDQVALPADQRVFKGMIGAKTSASGGKGSVRDYALAARRAGLDFVVFLEDFSTLEESRFAAMRRDCAENSGPDLLLLAGFWARTNVGNPLFVFGPEASWPPDALLKGPNKRTIYLQKQLPDGTFTGDNRTPFYEWILRDSPAGFFDFKSAPTGMRLYDTRFYSSAGIVYYRNGQLVEDVTDDYLLTNEATIGPTPLAIHAVDSPEELLSQARVARGLTYVVASSLVLDAPEGVYNRGLRWRSQFEAMQTFVSSGPEILRWPQTFRALTYGAEGFSPERSLLLAPIALRSSRGLREYVLYDGTHLFRRVSLNGVREHRDTLVLNGGLQKDLVLIAKDVRGKTAVSFPLRSWSEGSDAPMFCSDHLNDCKSQPLLARGPFSLPVSYPPELPAHETGPTWDGGPFGAFSALGAQNTLPEVQSGAHIISAKQMAAVPMLELSDEAVTAVATRRTRFYDARLAWPTIPWTTYGPISNEPPAIEYTQRYRQWRVHSEGAPPIGHAAQGVRHGAISSLFSSSLVFRRDTQVDALRLAQFRVPEGTRLAILSAGKEPVALDVDKKAPRNLPFAPGDALLVYGRTAMNAHLLINRGRPLEVRSEPVQLLSGDMPQRVVAGTELNIELAGVAFPLEPAVHAPSDVLPLLRLLSEPAAITVVRGTRESGVGLIDLAADDGAVELSAPAISFPVALPVRVLTMNPRWSAGLLLKEGNLMGFYGAAKDRYRALAVGPTGAAYFPLDAYGGPTRVLAGHPVVAGPEGKELFIQVTCLGGEPYRWHVSVNNPGSRPIKTKLRQVMALPGLAFEERAVTIGPGQLVVLQ